MAQYPTASHRRIHLRAQLAERDETIAGMVERNDELFDRAEAAERERDEARRLLAEAEEAIRDLVRVGDAMRFSMPSAAMAGKGQYDYVRALPAVKRALGEGK